MGNLQHSLSSLTAIRANPCITVFKWRHPGVEQTLEKKETLKLLGFGQIREAINANWMLLIPTTAAEIQYGLTAAYYINNSKITRYQYSSAWSFIQEYNKY